MDQTQSTLCNIINQLHNIEIKVKELDQSNRLERRFERIKSQLEVLSLFIHDPLHEAYDSTRLDCEASIAGDKTENLQIVEVIKPIVFHRQGEINSIIQRGVVIVEGK